MTSAYQLIESPDQQEKLTALIDELQKTSFRMPHPLQQKYLALRLIAFNNDFSFNEAQKDIVHLMLEIAKDIVYQNSSPGRADFLNSFIVLLKGIHDLIEDIQFAGIH